MQNSLYNPLTFLVLLIWLFPLKNKASEPPVTLSDTLEIEKPYTKTGTGWGGIPILSYDADLGFKYGAILNIFDYGDGSKFPDYIQYLQFRIAHSTKKNTQLQVLFDSDKIFNKTKVVMEGTFTADQLLNFYGFNGTNAIYNPKLADPDNAAYLNEHFYAQKRNLYRGRVDIQRQLGSPNFRLLMGFTVNYNELSSVNFEKFEPATGEANIAPSKTSLYDRYVEWEVIPEKEKSGGTINYLNLGLVYDTRDNQCACNSGLWIESYFLYAPDIISTQSFSKFVFTFRHYVDMPRPQMVFSYRLSSQTRTSGTIPYYMLPTYFDTKINRDGLGGGFNLRGASRNRIVADGFASGNFELRKKFLQQRILKLDFDFWLSAFSDLAYISQPYKINTANVPAELREEYFANNKQPLNATYGFGLYVIYNKNNIMSLTYGISPNKNLGQNGFYVGSSYLF